MTFVHIVSVTFVYDNAVGNLHDASFYALQLVARSCKLYQKEEVNHGVAGRFTLSYTYSLHKNLVISSSLA